jgi:hypothetical protein
MEMNKMREVRRDCATQQLAPRNLPVNNSLRRPRGAQFKSLALSLLMSIENHVDYTSGEGVDAAVLLVE